MEKYLLVLPYFLTACLIGIVASLLFGTSNNKITRNRIAREVFGSLWISAIAYFVLKQFCDWSAELIYASCSVTSFLNSKIINFLDKDLIEALFKGILNKIKLLANNTKNQES